MVLAGCSEIPLVRNDDLNFTSKKIKVFLGNGIKTGEVTQDQAIFWARTTQVKNMKRDGADFIPYEMSPRKFRKLVQKTMEGEAEIQQLPEWKTLADMKGAVPGALGEVRFTYYPESLPERTLSTPWLPSYEKDNFVVKMKVRKLMPGRTYTLIAETRPAGLSAVSDRIEGSFKTAPSPSESRKSTFVVVTCGDYNRRDNDLYGHEIYRSMLDLKPDFFIHTGDIEYYDKPNPWAYKADLAIFKWDRLFALPYLRNFHNQVTSYFMKDDHDTTMNDAWPGRHFGELNWDMGIEIFRQQFPLDQKTYRTIRWGKDLQVWMFEGRDYRSNNKEDDGPEKTIWGQEQKDWFYNTFKDSDATFKILVSPTPIVGPDRKNKNDNHANKAFKHEGDEIRSFVAQQKNTFIVCGDRHWQYHSIHPKAGIHEFSCGPSSDKHASGYKEEFRNEYHQYLKVLGGFLSVTTTTSPKPQINFAFHAPNGTIRYEQSFSSTVD